MFVYICIYVYILIHISNLFRQSPPDPRIHFALNCGAKGCPPIRFYKVSLPL